MHTEQKKTRIKRKTRQQINREKKKHREDEKNKIFFSIQANFQVNSKGNYLVDRSDTMNSL